MPVFFSLQISPPLNGVEYYAQRQFGTAEISVADADIEPLPGHTNPFRLCANRNATYRSYKLEFELTTGDPVALNNSAHVFPYRTENSNTRKGALLVYQGPLGHKTVVGTPLETPGDWNLGCLWIRIYEPDTDKGAMGGVNMPKVYFELPTGEKYFIGSDFSKLQDRADLTIPNRVTNPNPNENFGPETGWFKSWSITRSMLTGVCQVNGWNRIDSGARVREIELGWTGRGEFQPAPGNYEPHATVNNYASYLGRRMTVEPGKIAVLTGRLPTFPSTRNGEAVMTAGEVRYWSICGIDDDPLSPLPATTIHGIADSEVQIDANRNYVIAYSRANDRPANATEANGVSWVDWGTQSDMGLLIRYVNIDPEWTFDYSPQEHHLDFSHSDWAGTLYDSTLIGLNWRNGFMKCYLPKIHYLTKTEFEALGNNVHAEMIPAWVDGSLNATVNEARICSITASSFLDTIAVNLAHNVNDGLTNTAWSSAFGQQSGWIKVDLDTVKIISAIKLNWDWILFGKNYTLETSFDDVNWTVFATATNENGQIDLYKNLQNVNGRYVRLHLTQQNIFYYRLLEFEVYTNDCNCEAPNLATPNIEIRANALLQGAYNPVNQLHHTLLRNNNLLPNIQPFNTAPWFYNGSETAATIPANTTDWVLLEVRNISNVVIATRAALLLNNGSIIDANGSFSGVTFPNLLPGNYYLSLKTRNHAAVISSAPVTLPNIVPFAFSLLGNILFGTSQLVLAGNGQYTLKAGDLNADAIISFADFIQYISQSTASNQYLNADANLDGNVTITDFNLFLQNVGHIGASGLRY